MVGLTATMMVAEIAGGTIFGSMALLADGWHMSTHAGALAIAAFAYRFARRHARDPRFAFGTGKLGDLAGFASAIVLALVALMIGYESAMRLFQPVAIHYPEATAIAVVGLLVNLLSAWMLGAGHDHDHGHDHGGHHHDHDHNLRAAFWHVMADALTSVLAIAALLAAWVVRLDLGRSGDRHRGRAGDRPLVVAPDPRFRRGAARRRARPRAERGDPQPLESGHDRIADLHVWRLGPGHHAAIVSLVSDTPQPVEAYKARLADLRGLSPRHGRSPSLQRCPLTCHASAQTPPRRRRLSRDAARPCS